MRVAAVQFEPEKGQMERNRAALTKLVRESAAQGAELIVLPEMCLSGYVFPDKDTIIPFCETREGLSNQLFQTEAKRTGTTICFGWAETDPQSQKLYNSATVCRPDGQAIHYRKNLLFEADETWADPGNTPYPIWESRQGYRCSLGICMDLNDDRFIEHLKEHDIRVAAFPTNWLDQGNLVWHYWAWRMHTTSACLVAANRYGTDETTLFRGESAVLDVRVVLAGTQERRDEVILAEIPPEPTPILETA